MHTDVYTSITRRLQDQALMRQRYDAISPQTLTCPATKRVMRMDMLSDEQRLVFVHVLDHMMRVGYRLVRCVCRLGCVAVFGTGVVYP